MLVFEDALGGSEAEAGDERGRSVSGIRILIVDDRPQSRRQIRSRLRRSGYETVEAADGHEGWRAFRDRTPDAVVTDMRMPNGDGMDLLQRIRAHVDVPVFCVTAYPELDAGLLAMKRGAEYYYRWPRDLEKLLDDIDAAMGRRRPTTRPVPAPSALLSQIRRDGAREIATRRRESILAALRETHGNVGRAAELLQITRRTLYHWMDRYGVKDRPR
jgi:DNA-binding NtrC family response regulator